jgi:hypothetical protein
MKATGISVPGHKEGSGMCFSRRASVCNSMVRICDLRKSFGFLRRSRGVQFARSWSDTVFSPAGRGPLPPSIRSAAPVRLTPGSSLDTLHRVAPDPCRTPLPAPPRPQRPLLPHSTGCDFACFPSRIPQPSRGTLSKLRGDSEAGLPRAGSERGVQTAISEGTRGAHLRTPGTPLPQ